LVQVAFAVVALAALICLYVAVSRSYARWQCRRRWSRAIDAEAHARELLQGLGYTVLGFQVEKTYALLVDRNRKIVSLRADYVVSRGGRRYVAEVKSGKLAPSLDTAATRRQLLEYLVAFRVDGVLLVDGETHLVHEIVFPSPATGKLAVSRAPRLGWMLLGLAAMAAMIWMRQW